MTIDRDTSVQSAVEAVARWEAEWLANPNHDPWGDVLSWDAARKVAERLDQERAAMPAANEGEAVLDRYEKLDGVGLHAETIRTRASIGESYLECYYSALDDPLLKGWTPADCPSELVFHLLELASHPAPSDQEKLEGWQAIETAPLDGTHFLASLTVRHMGGQEWVETHIIWANDTTGTIDVECERGWEISDYELWMPVPSSPLTRLRAAGEGGRA